MLHDSLHIISSSWAYEAGDTVRVRLTLASGTTTDERWVDWMSAQLSGCFRRGAALEEEEALADERQRVAADRVYFFSSAPHVVLAGHCVVPGENIGFDLSGTLPTSGLPPSHRGEISSIEYAVIVTVRMMRPPSGWRATGWRRGQIHKLRLPLPVLLGAPRVNRR